MQRRDPYYAMCIKSYFKVNQGNEILAIKHLSEIYDLYAYAQPIFLLCCKLQIIILKTIGEVAETRYLLCHVYKVIFLNKSRICNSSKENSIRVLSRLCTCPAYLTTVQVSNYYLECSRSCGDGNRTMACVYDFFKVNHGYAYQRLTVHSEFCDPCAHAQSIFLLWC